MRELFERLLCRLGAHSWHYYEKYQGMDEETGKTEPALRCRICKRCRHQEFQGKIVIRHWE